MMYKPLWIVRISAGLLLILLLGCGTLARSVMNFDLIQQVRVTKISDLQKQSHLTTVYVKGKVVRKIPLLNAQVYLLEDTSGSIWILTEQNQLIELGEQVTIKGLIHYQSIPVEGQELGEIYIQEIEMLKPKPIQP